MNGSPLILHVDDDEDILWVTSLALESVGGLAMVQCDSGFKALDLAREHRPNLFLLDVMMPEIDGVETLKRLREIEGFENTPAIFLTAKASRENIQALMDAGAIAVLPKPFDPMTIASEIVALWQSAFQAQMSTESVA
ncbi:MAG: response regulator [Pseudomonadota bacterium]